MLTQLSSRDYIHHLKLQTDFEGACRINAKQDISEPRSIHPDLEYTINATQEEFAVKARNYLVFFLGAFLGDLSFNAEIVREMSSFDPVVLLTAPFEQASLCFPALYYSFSRCGWLVISPKFDCRDEYLGFLDFFRNAYHDFRDTPGANTDITELLTPMPELRARKHLFDSYQLSCLCLTSQKPDLPVVKFQGVVSSNSRCRLTDVILPAQSYLSNVAG